LPKTHGSAAVIAKISRLPTATPPGTPEPLFQEPGMRPSRALGYELHADARHDLAERKVRVNFRNTGRLGAVFHVYDQLQLERIPRRYTVEAGKELTDGWDVGAGQYHLWVLGPNGFLREFQGAHSEAAEPQARLRYDAYHSMLELEVTSAERLALSIIANAHRADGPWKLILAPGQPATCRWLLIESGHWYDFTARSQTWSRRFAGRLETGTHSVSDPAAAAG
jgi:phospholipase C